MFADEARSPHSLEVGSFTSPDFEPKEKEKEKEGTSPHHSRPPLSSVLLIHLQATKLGYCIYKNLLF